MTHTLFISDLHLCAGRPRVNWLFHDFIVNTASQAEALYILGDLFEYWAGDDDLRDPFNAEIAQLLDRLSQTGTAVYLMHGNRDFLLGDVFMRSCGARLLSDPTLIDLYGKTTLLMHGDTLCTDDKDYMEFRAKVHSADWQKNFLAQPLEQRKVTIEQLRRDSEREKKLKPAEVMDVNQEAVAAILYKHQYPRLIHGHTHRPARHEHKIDGMLCERWVLTDWYEHGGYLRCDINGCEAIPLF